MFRSAVTLDFHEYLASVYCKQDGIHMIQFRKLSGLHFVVYSQDMLILNHL